MSTLTLSHNDVAREVAYYLGLGRRDFADLDAQKQEEVAFVMDAGLRLFYVPPVVTQDGKSFEWDFLRPLLELDLFPSLAESDDDSPSSISLLAGNLIASYGAFYPSCVGNTITIKAQTGTATATTYSAGRTTIDVSGTPFSTSDASLVSSTIKFDTSGESYKIAYIDSTSSIKVEGNAEETSTNATDTYAIRTPFTIDRYQNATTVRPIAYPGLSILASKLFSMEGGTYRLPTGFAGFYGELSLGDGSMLQTIPLTGEGRIRQLRTLRPTTGVPQLAAIRIVKHEGADTYDQLYDLITWPTPDKYYTLHGRYNLIPQRFNQVNPEISYFVGGPVHSETILQACKAAAEHHINEERGREWEAFIDRLRTSMSAESSRVRAEYLGYNGDNSDGQHRSRGASAPFTVIHPTPTNPADGRPL